MQWQIPDPADIMCTWTHADTHGHSAEAKLAKWSFHPIWLINKSDEETVASEALNAAKQLC